VGERGRGDLFMESESLQGESKILSRKRDYTPIQIPDMKRTAEI